MSMKRQPRDLIAMASAGWAMLAAGQAAAQALAPVPHDGPRVVPMLPGPAPAYAVPATPPAPAYVPLPPARPALPVVPAPAYAVPAMPVTPVVPLAVRTLTLTEAKVALKGLGPGRHEIHFVHPETNCPARVELKLRGCVYDVKWHKFLGQHRLTLKVRGFANDVVVKFKRNGGVDVDG
jgi:hypothetical protein